jgi:type I restriction enzyme S subunit
VKHGKLVRQGLAFVSEDDLPDSRTIRLREDDIIVVRSGAYTGDSALVTADWYGSIAGFEIVLRTTRYAEPKFLAYALLSPAVFEQQIRPLSSRAAQPHLNAEELGDVEVFLPPVEVQRTTADYLDRETARVDALIAAKERVLELLAEKRRALITRAVTRGLDPHAALRDSGVPWLGEIPVHWHVVPLMHLTQPDRPIMYGIVLPGPDVGDGVPILKGGNVRPDRMKLASLARTTPEIESPYARARLREGDLVYSIRGSIGDCELVPRELQGSNITQDVARVAPRADISASWLRYSLLSEPIRQALASGSLGAAVRGVNIFDLKRARVPTPPLDEQESLVKYLTTSLDRLDSLASQTQLTIALSNERRAALIAAAVTGKIDVEASQ